MGPGGNSEVAGGGGGDREPGAGSGSELVLCSGSWIGWYITLLQAKKG